VAIVIEQSIATPVDTPSGSATSSSWTPGSNELCLCLIAFRGGNTPGNYAGSVTGNGLTWVKVLEKDDTQNTVNLSVWRAMGASPSAGGVTVNFTVDPTSCNFQIIRLSGVKTTGTNGSGAIGNTASADTGASDTTPATTSVTTSAANSRVIGFGSGRGQTWTKGAPFTDILVNQTASSAGNIVRSNSEYQDVAGSGSATTVDFSLSAAGDWVIAGIEILVASGTTFTQSTSGTLTSSGALIRKAKKVAAGTLTSSGAIIRKAKKIAAGTLTTAGALIRKAKKVLAGTLTSSGALTAFRKFVKTLAGTLTSSGALVRKGKKTLAGTLTTAGALAKRTAKTFAGTLTTAGGLTSQTLQIYYQVVGGTLTTAGALTRKAKKSIGGTLTTAGTIIRKAKKTLTGTLTSSGALNRGIAAAAVALNLAARAVLSLPNRLRTWTIAVRNTLTVRDK